MFIINVLQCAYSHVTATGTVRYHCNTNESAIANSTFNYDDGDPNVSKSITSSN